MDLKFSAEDEAYRVRLKQWIRDHASVAVAMAKAPDPIQAAREWTKSLDKPAGGAKGRRTP